MKSDQPKVMHTLAGLPMINWLLNTVETLQPAHIITVVGPDMPQLEAAVAPHQTVIQQKRNGTGGALACALPLLKDFTGDILVLLGDTPMMRAETLQNLIATKQANPKNGLSVLGVDLPSPKGFGRLIQNQDGSLQHIIEEKDSTDTQRSVTLVNTGAFCLDAQLTQSWITQINTNNAQGELYITDLPAIAAQDSHTTAIAQASCADEVVGCNTRIDLAALEATAQARLRDAAMLQGVQMLDPSTVHLHHDTIIEADVLIEPNLFCGPAVTIKSGAHIKAFCHFEDCIIGKSAIVGPFARLRPGTVLGEEVRIGNFVEVKKSTIGNRSKINHLGYVGDCVMGEDVNFSAGAITVNYDGFDKHQTTIGNSVMVGSNANLVAPISINDGAFIAAGSTITEDVPADSLSIARDKGQTRQGWASEYRKRKQMTIKKINK